MEDRPYLLGKLAALESALDAAIATHPDRAALVAALADAMCRYTPAYRPQNESSFAEGWMAIVTPLLTDQACRAANPIFTSRSASGDGVQNGRKRRTH
ncbi:MAG TPA: hypothetical protein VM621_11330 [Luteibacter sp.]|uniref:hypothetical protein n=1 Tax=Luteibacter sp. TaxID=1886636 RepID=UPI002CB89F20|nr:hypothetical protein [Luteibacter sp.]HVI55623.1 hypothetical protein [Luteibacter sp.]